MNLQVYWTGVAFLLCKATTVLALAPCDPEVRSTNMDDCLTQVKTGVMDKDKFWFGTQYSTDCPNGPVSMSCGNAHCTNTGCPEESLEMRLFPNGLNLTLIDKYLEVQYVSEKGSYTACGNTFDEESWQGEVTPTSSVVYRPWTLRNMPQMTWTASDDEYYTIIFFDVGNFILHLVYVNIPGDDVMNGELKRFYNGPKVSFYRDNLYAFFLFKQEGHVTIAQEWETKINSFALVPFSIPDFAEAHNMTGPVAVNWLVATGDPYAAQFMETSGILNNCPIFVGKGDMYTLITVDPDVPFAAAGTEARPLLHMMVVNIVDGDVNTGEVVQTYRGPSPPDANAPHYYYFLLYKQEAEVNATMMPSYAGDSCSGSLQGRCLFDINTAVNEQNLTLVGATWMRAVYDDYVIVRSLNTSDPEAVNATCFGRSLFEVPCPTSTSTGSVTFISCIVLVVAAAVSMVI